MPFKPLSNALLSPYKVPFGAHLYNYLITKNLRWLLSNPFFHPSPTFTLQILSIYFDRWWMLGGGCWVVGVNGFYKVHCKSTHHHHPTPITQHSIPHIINTQHPTFNIHHPTSNTHHPTFNPTHHQHSTFITQHPTFNPTHHQHPTPNTQHPTFPTPLIS